jgi:hypothetical protein
MTSLGSTVLVWLRLILVIVNVSVKGKHLLSLQWYISLLFSAVELWPCDIIWKRIFGVAHLGQIAYLLKGNIFIIKHCLVDKHWWSCFSTIHGLWCMLSVPLLTFCRATLLNCPAPFSILFLCLFHLLLCLLLLYFITFLFLKNVRWILVVPLLILRLLSFSHWLVSECPH